MFRKMMMLAAVLLMVIGFGSVRPAVYAQDAMDPAQPLPMYLLTIRGTLASKTLEEAQNLHNTTAGDPNNMAGAQSLGDLTHMVYLPITQNGNTPGEVLFMDQWNSIEGLNQFFANPQVQEQAGQIFSERDPLVWVPAEGFYSYHLAVPYGKNDRIIAMVRGTVSSREAAMALHNQIVGSQINAAHAAGDISHEAYFMFTPPDAPESMDFLAVDVWTDAAGMNAYYSNPDFQSGVMQLFTAAPDISLWNQTTGEWVEW